MEPSSRFSFPLILAAGFALAFLFGWSCRRTAPASRAQNSTGASGASSATENAAPTGAGRAFEKVATAKGESDYRRALLLEEAAAALNADETVAALERQRVRIGNRYDYNGDVTEALLARYAELDPGAATLWYLQAYPRAQRAEWTQVTLYAWVTQDREAALKWARGLPTGLLRDSATSDLLNRLIAVDPAAAELEADALKADESQWSKIYLALAEKDLPGTLARAMKFPDRRANQVIGDVLRVWAKRDFAAALAWTEQLPPDALQHAAVGGLRTDWIKRDPAAAAAYLAARGGTEYANSTREIALSWVKQDVDAARVWAEGLPSRARAEALGTVVRSWAERDPRAAAEYAAAQSRPGKFGLVDTALSQWQEADLPGATAWIETLPPGEMRDDARASVCRSWANRDPRACLDYLDHQPSGKALDDLRGICVGDWAEVAPEKVWEWSRGLTDAVRREEAGATALTKLAASDPAKAGALFGQLSPVGKTNAASEIAAAWEKIDLPTARQWVVSLPESEARDAAWGELLNGWSEHDPAEAAAWLETRPAGPSKDAGIGGLEPVHTT